MNKQESEYKDFYNNNYYPETSSFELQESSVITRKNVHKKKKIYKIVYFSECAIVYSKYGKHSYKIFYC